VPGLYFFQKIILIFWDRVSLYNQVLRSLFLSVWIAGECYHAWQGHSILLLALQYLFICHFPGAFLFAQLPTEPRGHLIRHFNLWDAIHIYIQSFRHHLYVIELKIYSWVWWSLNAILVFHLLCWTPGAWCIHPLLSQIPCTPKNYFPQWTRSLFHIICFL
jgi:hypothetical protein